MTFSLQIVDVQVYLNPFLQYRHSDFIAGRGVNRFVVIIISFTAYLLSTEWRGPGIDPLPSRRCLTPALQTCGADMKGVMALFISRGKCPGQGAPLDASTPEYRRGFFRRRAPGGGPPPCCRFTGRARRATNLNFFPHRNFVSGQQKNSHWWKNPAQTSKPHWEVCIPRPQEGPQHLSSKKSAS